MVNAELTLATDVISLVSMAEGKPETRIWPHGESGGKGYKEDGVQFCPRHPCSSSWKLSPGGKCGFLRVGGHHTWVAAKVTSESHVVKTGCAASVFLYYLLVLLTPNQLQDKSIELPGAGILV